MKKMLSFALVTIALASFATGATAQQLFDFNGQTLLPGAVGGHLTMYSVVYDPAPGTTPIPLDFASYEFTLVVTDLELVNVNGNAQEYAGGTVTIYQDDATSADYTNIGTFTDGTAVLIGTVDLNRIQLTATLTTIGGLVDWTGGTRLDDIALADQVDWPFLSGASNSATVTEPGYDENWDGKVEPEHEIIDNETVSWGGLRVMYR
ncbi:MAG: hypothetical protein ABIF77_04990 [bacterium]